MDAEEAFHLWSAGNCTFACNACKPSALFKGSMLLKRHFRKEHEGITRTQHDHQYGQSLIRTAKLKCPGCNEDVLHDYAELKAHVEAKHDGMDMFDYFLDYFHEKENDGREVQKSPSKRKGKDNKDVEVEDMAKEDENKEGKDMDSKNVTNKVGNFCRYRCSQCASVYADWNDFSDHISSEHGMAKRFKADYLWEVAYHQCNHCPKKILSDITFIKFHVKGTGGHPDWQEYLDEHKAKDEQNDESFVSSQVSTKSSTPPKSMQYRTKSKKKEEDKPDKDRRPAEVPKQKKKVKPPPTRKSKVKPPPSRKRKVEPPPPRKSTRPRNERKKFVFSDDECYFDDDIADKDFIPPRYSPDKDDDDQLRSKSNLEIDLDELPDLASDEEEGQVIKARRHQDVVKKPTPNKLSPRQPSLKKPSPKTPSQKTPSSKTPSSKTYSSKTYSLKEVAPPQPDPTKSSELARLRSCSVVLEEPKTPVIEYDDGDDLEHGKITHRVGNFCRFRCKHNSCKDIFKSWRDLLTHMKDTHPGQDHDFKKDCLTKMVS